MLAERRGKRKRSAQRQVAVSLVDHQETISPGGKLRETLQFRLTEHDACRIVWTGDADNPRLRSNGRRKLLEIDLKSALERQIHEADPATDGAWRFKIGGIVGPHHDQMIIGTEQCGRNDEQSPGGTAGNQDVVRGQLSAIDNHVPEALTSPMFSIKKRQIRNREAETLQRLIRD